MQTDKRAIVFLQNFQLGFCCQKLTFVNFASYNLQKHVNKQHSIDSTYLCGIKTLMTILKLKVWYYNQLLSLMYSCILCKIWFWLLPLSVDMMILIKRWWALLYIWNVSARMHTRTPAHTHAHTHVLFFNKNFDSHSFPRESPIIWRSTLQRQAGLHLSYVIIHKKTLFHIWMSTHSICTFPTQSTHSMVLCAFQLDVTWLRQSGIIRLTDHISFSTSKHIVDSGKGFNCMKPAWLVHTE